MKKLLPFLLALCLLLSFTACGADSQDASQSGSATQPQSTKHNHSYLYQVTTEPTCINEGLKTFTCTCGDFYTEKIPATGEHTWGNWERKSYAFIDKVGSEEHICLGCSTAETREQTKNAVANSFQDGGLQYLVGGNGNLSPFALYGYACHEFHDFIETPNIPAEVFFALLSQCFDVTEQTKNEIKNSYKSNGQDGYGYNPANDTFFLPYYAESGEFNFLGYTHLEGNRYMTYYAFSEFTFDSKDVFWSFEVEFNRSAGKPNKYFSAKPVDSVPSDIIETDGWVEFEGPIAK